MGNGRSVTVRDNNVEKALRKLKKKVNNSKVLMEVRERKTYTKPTTKKKLAKNAAKRRWDKEKRQNDPVRFNTDRKF